MLEDVSQKLLLFMPKNKLFNFTNQLSIGKQGEILLDKWLGSNYEIEDVSDVRKYQESGIDRILMCPDGVAIKVEYKFDIASSRTGNLFFETLSVDKENIPGWGWRSQADYWIFLLPAMEVIIVEPANLRSLVWQLRANVSEKRVQNLGYQTIGIPIPLEKVKNIAYCVTNINQNSPKFK